MANLTNSDFKYFKDKIKKDKDKHEKEFIQRINPDLIDAYYEGDPDKLEENGLNATDRISLNTLFPTTITLAAQFYPQNPKFVAMAKRDGDELNANIAASSMNYYYEQMGAVRENQWAIMSAWLYGFGATKQGWRTVIKTNDPAKIDSKTTEKTFASRIAKPFTGNVSMEEEETPDYIAEEGPFLYFINPKDLYFDCDEPFGRGKYFTHHLKRCLYDIRTSGLYKIGEDFYSRFKQGKDEREVKLDLYEQWSWQRDGLYVFVFCDGWDKPLRFDKFPTAGEGFPFKILSLTTQINRVYPMPNARIAQRLQRLSDYILTLNKQAVERYRDIMVWDKNAFGPHEQAQIRANRIGSNIFSSRPPSQAGQHYGGANIPKDLFGVQEIVSNNIKEILSVVGAKLSGESEFDTLGQEKIGEFGNQLRAQGMQQNIRDFLKAQGRKLLQDIKQFDTSEKIIKVTGLDLTDPETGLPVTEKWVEFATDRSPQTLREIIPQELDIDVDITNTANRDLPVIRKQLSEIIGLVTNPAIVQLLAAQGKMVRVDKLIEDAIGALETSGNPSNYIEDIPQQVPTQPIPQGAPPIPQESQVLPQGGIV